MSVLFTNVTAVTMDPDAPLLEGGFVATEGTRVAYAGPERPQGAFDRTVDCAGKVMLPGFVNAHTHIPMTLLRGYGGGHNLQDWLNDFIYPAEAKLDDRCVAAATDLGLAEMISSGVTRIADMYMHTGVIAREILNAGISANLSCGGLYFGDPKDFSPETCADCHHQTALTEEWHGAGDGQIRVDASIHGEYTSSAPFWQWMADYAHAHSLGMHVHLSETASEHEASIARNGKTPFQTLDQYGVWDTRAIAAHCVWTTPEDWALMAQKGVSAVHNPWSNLKLGSGVAPVPDQLAAGVNVCLGTDGVSSHNSTDMFQDIKLAAVLHCGVRRDPMALTSLQALQMATVRGAKALGRDTGVIAAGKTADLILVDFSHPNLVPCHDVVENLVFSARGSDVCMNMARGRIIYENGAFLTLDLEKILREVREYAVPHIFGA